MNCVCLLSSTRFSNVSSRKQERTGGGARLFGHSNAVTHVVAFFFFLTMLTFYSPCTSHSYGQLPCAIKHFSYHNHHLHTIKRAFDVTCVCVRARVYIERIAHSFFPSLYIHALCGYSRERKNDFTKNKTHFSRDLYLYFLYIYYY